MYCIAVLFFPGLFSSPYEIDVLDLLKSNSCAYRVFSLLSDSLENTRNISIIKQSFTKAVSLTIIDFIEIFHSDEYRKIPMQKAILLEHPDLPKHIPHLIEHIEEHRRHMLSVELPKAKSRLHFIPKGLTFFLLTAGTGYLLHERNSILFKDFTLHNRNAEKVMNFVPYAGFKLNGFNTSYFLLQDRLKHLIGSRIL
jgi:hypothetical protein